MKKIILFSLLLVISNFAFSEKVTMKQGDTIQKIIFLDFTETAVHFNYYLKFKISGDTDKFDVSSSLSAFEENELIIYAKEYSEKGVIITFIPKSNLKKGVYTLNLNLVDVSDEMKHQISELQEIYTYTAEVQFTPPPFWKRYLVHLISLFFAICIIIYLYVNSLKFKSGGLNITEPINEGVRLKGKKNINSKDYEFGKKINFQFVLNKGKKGQPKIAFITKGCIIQVNDKPATTGSLILKGSETIIRYNEEIVKFTYI